MRGLMIFALATTLFAGSSCSDFLDVVPEDMIPQEEALQSVADCESYIAGVYDTYKGSALYSGALTLLPDVQADYVYSVKGYSNTYGEIYKWEITSTTPEVETIYRALYRVVAQANFYLEFKGGVKVNNESEQLNFDNMTGEIYLARALAFSELIRIYCGAYDPDMADKQLGISLSLSYTARDQKIIRSSLKDSYAQVLRDIEQAEKLIVDDRSDNPYFSVAAVQMLKARVFLMMNKWDEAVAAATKVIDNPKYELASGINFYNMFRFDTGNEIIWKLAMSNTDRGGALGQSFINYNGSIYLPDYVPARWIIDLYKEFGDADVRGKVYITQQSVSTGYSHGLEWPFMVKYAGNAVIDAGGRPLFTNMPKVFRLAEAYLIRAEAYYHMGKNNEASKDISTLRKARISGAGTFSASGDFLYSEIKKERIRELFMEGHRLSDLKRWNEGFKRVPQAETNDGANKLDIAPGRYEFTWPIPQHELDAVPDIQPNPSNGKN
ncbi:MAG: RagB/SusD family nutrient uptake outer membrane protein [Breznakibacter sp.]|nr:RagB/SusD family nutrient uptake outer membrane protein [Breznakibacter sp.]